MAANERDVAVVGPAGLVGSEILELLEARAFPVRALRLLGSARTAGGRVELGGREEPIELLGPRSFEGADIVFFAAGPTVSEEHAPVAVAAGAAVIDLSTRFRLDPAVPLVVPEVNAGAIGERHARGIVASPSAITVALSVVLAPLAAAGLRRVVVSTYQGAAGAGRRGVDRLSHETLDLLSARGDADDPGRLAFNCLPQIGAVEPGGVTTHELHVVEETRKVLGDPELALTVTAVRVPVFFGHAASLVLETERPLGAEAARALLRAAPGVLLHHGDASESAPTPAEVVGSDALHVGRVRDDAAAEHGLALWVALDGTRKGAALNAVAIAEILLRDL